MVCLLSFKHLLDNRLRLLITEITLLETTGATAPVVSLFVYQNSSPDKTKNVPHDSWYL